MSQRLRMFYGKILGWDQFYSLAQQAAYMPAVHRHLCREAWLNRLPAIGAES